MQSMPSDDRQGVIEHLRRYAVKRMTAEEATLFLPLAERYYERVAAEDLIARSVPDLFGAALAHLRLAQHRAPDEPQVAVFSPTFDEHGFASPHTVVQVVTEDMPFVPDSLTTELSRHGFGLHIAIHPVFVVQRSGAGELLAVLNDDPLAAEAATQESFHHIEIDRQADAGVLDRLRLDLIRVLGDVRAGEFGLEEPSGWIERFGIDPAFRGRDLGKLMFAALLAHFREAGVARVRARQRGVGAVDAEDARGRLGDERGAVALAAAGVEHAPPGAVRPRDEVRGQVARHVGLEVRVALGEPLAREAHQRGFAMTRSRSGRRRAASSDSGRAGRPSRNAIQSSGSPCSRAPSTSIAR